MSMSNLSLCIWSKRDLRELEIAIGLLLALLVSDIDNLVAAKAAFGIRSLVSSRVCMNAFINLDGLVNNEIPRQIKYTKYESIQKIDTDTKFDSFIQKFEHIPRK